MQARQVVISTLLSMAAAACGGTGSGPDGPVGGGARAGMVAPAGGNGGQGGTASGNPGGTTGTGAIGGSSGAAGTTTGGGSGGTSGAGAATVPSTVSAGVLFPCPDPPPLDGDVCPNDALTCTYPGKKSCACYSNLWKCNDCPASQPTAADLCNAIPFRLSMSCNYGNVTCSCQRRTGDTAWHCGVCPPSEPLTGDLCGNVPAGNCRYGADTCSCGTNGIWSCATATCPANPYFGMAARRSCTSPNSAYTCRYPEQDQDCICLPDSDTENLPCSCPASRPPEGGACIARTAACVYGDISCGCSNFWHCASTTPPNPCPTTRPAAGETCSTRISTCAYEGVICACDGTSWACS